MLISNILENKSNILNFTCLVISVWTTSPPCFQLLWDQTSQLWRIETYDNHPQFLSSDILSFYEFSPHTDAVQSGPRHWKEDLSEKKKKIKTWTHERKILEGYWWRQGLNRRNYAISTLVVTTLPDTVIKKSVWKVIGSLVLGSGNEFCILQVSPA